MSVDGSSFAERQKFFDKRRRALSSVKTYMKSAVWYIRNSYDNGHPDEREYAGYEAFNFMESFFLEIDGLVPMVRDGYQIEEIERYAKEIVSACKKRRQIAALRKTAGFTPEETALRLAKADEIEREL
jgi:hypothetical protein